MALSRSFLESLGIEGKQVEAIIEANAESIEGIKADRDAYKKEAAKVPSLQKQLEEAKAADKTEELQSKLDEALKAKETAETALADANKSLEDYKAEVKAEKDAAAKAGAYRKQVLEAAGIGDRYLDDVMAVTRLDDVELDEEGVIKDADKLVEAARGKWQSFVVKTETKPAEVDDPPAPKGGVEGASLMAQQIAKEHHERLFGKSEE